MPIEVYHLVAGENIDGDDRFEHLNPANNDEVVSVAPQGNEQTARAAIEAAAEALPGWANTPAPARGEILFRAADQIDRRTDELAELMTREEGKTLAESRAEVIRTRELFRYYAGMGRTISGETLPPDKPDAMLFTRREPLGVISVITPWNFPMAIAAWKLGPALVAGCTVVFKPASLVPACGFRLVEILHEAGLPPGVLNFVTGAGSVVGHEMVTHPFVKAVSFTGSYQVGHQIHQQAAPMMTRTQLEMGGKNALIVLDDADLDLAVNLAVRGGFGLTGQACTATSRAIVQTSVLPAFTEALVQRAQSIEVGDGLRGAQMGPAVDESQLKTDMEYIEVGGQEGAKLLAGGSQLREGASGHFISPTVFGEVAKDMRIAQEEIFGPVIGIMPARDLDEAIEICNGIEFGLSAGIVTRDLRTALLFAERVESGVVKINQKTTGVAVQAPFGGLKKSSSNTFREQGKTAIDFFTRSKTVYLDYPV
jgi:acyl-CoA reductase-like NAD-dependent aldehyde dehydrogenase